MKTMFTKIKKFFDNLHSSLKDKKRRRLFLLLFILPFIIVIVIFGYKLYKEVDELIGLITNSAEISDENKIESLGFVLRDNATDYQKELFKELKDSVEVNEIDDKTIAELVCKNFIADFYTWTNKQGQYDVGGMYYIYDGEFKDGSHFRENVYENARYGFYKYMNTYINEYGKENLLEVDSVSVTFSNKVEDMIINEHVSNKQDENGEWYDYREDHSFNTYYISCSWTYKQNEKFDSSSFSTSSNFVVINDGDSFYIVAADDKEIDYSNDSDLKDEDLDENEIDNDETNETNEVIE